MLNNQFSILNITHIINAIEVHMHMHMLFVKITLKKVGFFSYEPLFFIIVNNQYHNKYHITMEKADFISV